MRAGKVFAVILLALSVGLHWQLLQSVAWVSMLARYVQQESWQAAVHKTFDGKHPCSLCKLVAQAKEKEHAKQNSQCPAKKLDLYLESGFSFDFLQPGFPPPQTAGGQGLLRFARPPSPPPRSV